MTMMMMMMMNCFYGMVDRRKAFRFISSRDHCQRSSSFRISDTPQAGFEPAQNPSSGLVESSCAVVITSRKCEKCLRYSMNRIQSKDHRIQAYEINKISFSCFDDKIYIQNNGCGGLALGY